MSVVTGPRVMYRFRQLSRIPRTSRPWYVPRQTTPRLLVEAASLPASGPVRAKQGISSAVARRGRKWRFCSSVPKCSKSSAGPSEFGTITVTAAATLRLEILVTTAELAIAENPSPPYSSGMIIPKNFFSLMNRHASGARSPSRSTFHSSTMPQSSSTGPSRKARSRALSGLRWKSRSFFQSGRPEKSSPSHQTVPASSAIRSVSPMRGSARASARMTKGVTVCRRPAGIRSTTAAANTKTRIGPSRIMPGIPPKHRIPEIGSGLAAADQDRDSAQVLLIGGIGKSCLVHQADDSPLAGVGPERFHDMGVGAGASVESESPECPRRQEVPEGERAEGRRRRQSEIEAQESPVGTEQAENVAQERRQIGRITEPIADRDGVEGAVGEGEVP